EESGADVHVATRKQKAFEADLVEAKRVRKETTICSAEIPHSEIRSTEKKERKKLALLEKRVDLNHIMHHPKQKKYISLFPPEVRQQQPEEEDDGSSKTRQSRKRTLNERRSGK
ncbi:hypothetical protein PHLCEN_2v2013, partial [Hermanssonia centrifuga]